MRLARVQHLWPDYLSRDWIVLLAALLSFVLAKTLPPFQLFDSPQGVFLYLHLMLELFAVVVAALVVLMAWHTMDPMYARVSNLLIGGFTFVAGCDLLHALSYQGMPGFLVPGSTQAAIFYWLAGRSAEVLVIALLALRLQLPGRQWQWQTAALVLTALLWAFATFRLDWFPATYSAQYGLTPFKTRFEYVLSALNFLLAAWLWRMGRGEERSRLRSIALSCVLIGFTELMVTSYQRPTEFSNIFAHVFKVLAYILIFRSTFRISMTLPFELLRQSRNEIRRQQDEVESIMRHMHGGIIRLDLAQRVVYMNENIGRYLDHAPVCLPGVPLAQALSAQHYRQVHPHVLRALAGEGATLQMTMENGAEPRHLAVSVAPQRDDDGHIIGCVLLLVDVSASQRTLRRLETSLKDLSELSAALDAHALVAVTDARGIILRVNDKSCAISQYSREELVGRSHSLINSGRHPPQFFQDLWCTIRAGKVWSGEICNRSRDGGLYWVYTTIVPFMGADGVPVQYMAIRADITERKRIEQETEKLAFYDALTGLPNRRLLAERLERSQIGSQRSGLYCGLMFVDLDDFKAVNDVHGHGTGDCLLQLVGQRMQAQLRESDTVARFGGDEFVVLLADLGLDAHQAGEAAQAAVDQIMHAVSQECTINGAHIRCSVSVGVVLFRGTEVDGQALMQQADMALYKAKERDTSSCHFFDPQLQAVLIHEARFTVQLRRALPGGELRLHYQPVVDRHGAIVGVEALIRWAHPEQGMISPAEFIPLAERNGQIVEIGVWVLETACRQLAAWGHSEASAAWTVAVNVSPRQFRHAGFVAQVQRALSASGASAERLKLELTEGMLLHNVQETIDKMEALRRVGVRFSLDDFGTGYSSLSYLQRLPLAQLKIDQSFVRHVMDNPNDAAIVRTILSLAGALQLEVVAEGVETAEQYALLIREGCDRFQGYLFGRAVPAEQLETRRAPAAAAST